MRSVTVILKKQFKFFIFLFILSIVAGSLQAGSVGYLIIEKGIVKIKSGLQTKIYKQVGKKISINNQDRIQTAINTRAKIHLTKKKDVIDLFSKTYFKINNIDASESSLGMPIGKAQFVVNKHFSKRKRRFKIRTANAVIGVRGTDFVVGVDGGQTSVLTLEGVVGISNPVTPDIEVLVPQNQASTVQKSQTPTKPVTVPPRLRKQIIQADNPKVFKQVKFGEKVKVSTVKKKKKKKKDKKDKKKKKDKKDKKDKKSGKKDKKKEDSKDKKKVATKGKKESSNKSTEKKSAKGNEKAVSKQNTSKPADKQINQATKESATISNKNRGESPSTITPDKQENTLNLVKTGSVEPVAASSEQVTPDIVTPVQVDVPQVDLSSAEEIIQTIEETVKAVSEGDKIQKEIKLNISH